MFQQAVRIVRAACAAAAVAVEREPTDPINPEYSNDPIEYKYATAYGGKRRKRRSKTQKKRRNKTQKKRKVKTQKKRRQRKSKRSKK